MQNHLIMSSSFSGSFGSILAFVIQLSSFVGSIRPSADITSRNGSDLKQNFLTFEAPSLFYLQVICQTYSEACLFNCRHLLIAISSPLNIILRS